MARKVGLTSAGLLGFSLQSCLLAVCVASVWAPGSPFSLTGPDSEAHLESTNHDQIIPTHQHAPPPVSPTDTWRLSENLNISVTTSSSSYSYSPSTNDGPYHSSYVSVTLLLAGRLPSLQITETIN